MNSNLDYFYVESTVKALQFRPEVNWKVGLFVFLLVEDWLAKEDPDVKVFVWHDCLGDGTGMVHQWRGRGKPQLHLLILDKLIVDFFFEFVDSTHDVFELFVE